MPKLNGYEVARKLRERAARCVLVAVTGWGQEEDRRRAREAGFDRHLVKPVEPGRSRRSWLPEVRRAPTAPLPGRVRQ
jgi:CheY-like chemotaxis protein